MTSASPSPGSPRGSRAKLDLRARIALPICALLLAALAIHRLILADPAPTPIEFSGSTMGTTYSVKLVGADLTGQERTSLANQIDETLGQVDALMSTYDADSELSNFNRHRSPQPFRVSDETLAVFRVAQQVSEMSGGAFDITVGPLVAAWGFGASDRPPEPPSPEELAKLRERVGYRKISLHPTDPWIVKLHPEIECDLSAIAKGYGVDRVAEALIARGHRNFLIEVGGELRAGGTKDDAQPWRVGIERPDAEIRTTERILSLRDMALATSGDYRNYYEVDGTRISHTIDPREGRPIRHHLASVSVLHPEAIWADALATTLNVLGPEEGIAWAEENAIAALLLVRGPDGVFETLETAAFRALQKSP